MRSNCDNEYRSSPAELEVTHHIDSLLGTAIAILFFFMGMTVKQQAQRSSEDEAAVALLVIAMILWLVGILKRKWPVRLVAWWSVFFLTGTELFLMIRNAIEFSKLSVVAVWIMLAGVSYIALRRIVVEGYLYRLSCACDEDTYSRRREVIEASTRWPVAVSIAIGFAWAVLALVG
jgi:membrane-associated HD superfamily phosphohydrolase